MKEIVIKLSDVMYERLIESKGMSVCAFMSFAEAVKNGTELPKGHGRMIDADAYRKEMLDSREFDFFKRLDMQPTIIEADKGEEYER